MAGLLVIGSLKMSRREEPKRPLLHQDTPAPAGLRLGVHPSMVIAPGAPAQNLPANGNSRPPNRRKHHLNSP